MAEPQDNAPEAEVVEKEPVPTMVYKVPGSMGRNTELGVSYDYKTVMSNEVGSAKKDGFYPSLQDAADNPVKPKKAEK